MLYRVVEARPLKPLRPKIGLTIVKLRALTRSYNIHYLAKRGRPINSTENPRVHERWMECQTDLFHFKTTIDLLWYAGTVKNSMEHQTNANNNIDQRSDSPIWNLVLNECLILRFKQCRYSNLMVCAYCIIKNKIARWRERGELLSKQPNLSKFES